MPWAAPRTPLPIRQPRPQTALITLCWQVMGFRYPQNKILWCRVGSVSISGASSWEKAFSMKLFKLNSFFFFLGGSHPQGRDLQTEPTPFSIRLGLSKTPYFLKDNVAWWLSFYSFKGWVSESPYQNPWEGRGKIKSILVHFDRNPPGLRFFTSSEAVKPHPHPIQAHFPGKAACFHAPESQRPWSNPKPSEKTEPWLPGRIKEATAHLASPWPGGSASV